MKLITKAWVNNHYEDREIEPIVDEPQDEPITFNNKAELDNYIADFIVEFLTEGDTNDNGSN